MSISAVKSKNELASAAKPVVESLKKSVDTSNVKSAKSVVAAPLQIISRYPSLPRARPNGVVIKDSIEITLSGLDIKHKLSGHQFKNKVN